MATRKKPVPTDDTDDLENIEEQLREVEPEEREHLRRVFDELSDDDGDLRTALDSTLAELGDLSEVSMNVYRTPRHGRKLAFLFTYQPDEYTFGELQTKLRDEYGGGDFRLQVRYEQRLVANRGFAVEPPKKEAREPENRSNDMMMLVIQQMNQQSQQNMQMMLEMFKAQNTGRREIDPIEMQTNLITQLATLKELTSDSGKKGSDIDILLKGIELHKELEGKQGDTNFNDILMEGIKALGSTAIHAQTAPTQKPPVAHQAPAPQTTPDEAAQQMNLQFKMSLAFLVSKAKENKDPALYADLVLDNLEVSVIETFVNNPDIIDILAQHNPAVKAHETWFLRLRDEIKLAIGDEAAIDEGDESSDDEYIESENDDALIPESEPDH